MKQGLTVKIVWIFTGIVLSSLFGRVFATGDQNPGYNYTYPTDCLIQNGGRIYNVKNPPDGRPAAVGNGVVDDTTALISAYEYVAQKVIDHFNNGVGDFGRGYDDDATFLIYIPDGTYLVSEPIIYPQPSPALPKQATMVYIRFIGQSKEHTVLRLKDNTFTDPDNPKTVLSYHKEGGSSEESVNICANLTINVGNGNPGAIGLLFQCPNTSNVYNIRLTSEDGQGKIGLHFPVWSVQGHFRDITIKGFDIGIRAVWNQEVNPVFSHVTLQNQNVAGIENVDAGAVFVRQLRSTNSVPAILATGKLGHTVIIDSELTGGSPENAAIQLNGKGVTCVRNVSVAGYGSAIKEGSTVKEAGPLVDEWLSHPVTNLFDRGPDTTMNLPIEDPPEIPYFNPSTEWASPDHYGAVGDGLANDSAAVQAALDSGKPVVYFRKKNYKTAGPLSVPATVRRVNFLYAYTAQIDFEIDEASPHPILFEHSGGLAGKGGPVQITSKAQRTVVCRSGFITYNNQLSPAADLKVFLEGTVHAGTGNNTFCKHMQRTWGFGINTEDQTVQFKASGGTLWAAGVKCERRGVAFRAEHGAKIEVMSGFANTFNQDGKFLLENDNSEMSVMFLTQNGGKWDNIICERQGNTVRTTTRSDHPDRSLPWTKCVFIPLYSGFENTGRAD